MLRTSLSAVIIVGLLPIMLPGQESVPTLRIRHGDLSVLFRDNSESPQVLSGLDSLFNLQQAPGYDAFDPDTVGASAGLNFEHIISGHRSPDNKFTPRSGRYTLTRQPDGRSVLLVRRADDSPWKVASTLKYEVRAPHFVDFEFRCSPKDASLFDPHGYALFFFANYMNNVVDSAIHFRGYKSADSAESWIRADAPPGHRDWNTGGNYRAAAAAELKYDDDVEFRLNTWSYDWPRLSKPFYYGRADKGMTLILMFDRLHSERDQIRFSLYKFKLPKRPRPAWDFQYVINRVESGAEYGFRGRLVWKKFVSPEDCQREYESWAAKLEADRKRVQADRIRRLRKLGATVFIEDEHVAEVNANGTTIGDDDLAMVSEFSSMTDLSLERTNIGNDGLLHLRNLDQLEWLNLYRTRVGDDGLRTLSRMRSLRHLPIGETRVTDRGLTHVAKMQQLVYLGVRGNGITDSGVEQLRQLRRLQGLHLGETRITDSGVRHLSGMSRLTRLWLDNTTVSDQSIPALGGLKSLRELDVHNTQITAAGVKRLRHLLPRCRVQD